MPTHKKSSSSSISWSSILSSKISDKLDSTGGDKTNGGSISTSAGNRFARLNLQNNQKDEEKIRGLSVDPSSIVSTSSSSLLRNENQPMRDETWVMGGIGALLGLFCVRIFRVRKRRRRGRGK